MELAEDVRDVILDPGASKAFATSGPCGLNVVPVSAVRIVEKYLFLFDFFMDKTVQNIQADADVSLVAWSGLNGYPIKASCTYESSGEHFEDAKNWSAQRFPDRTLHGVLVLDPSEVHDISIAEKV